MSYLSDLLGDSYKEGMQNGEYIRSTTDFYSSMDKAGYNRIRKNTGVQVVGLKLKEGQDFLE